MLLQQTLLPLHTSEKGTFSWFFKADHLNKIYVKQQSQSDRVVLF